MKALVIYRIDKSDPANHGVIRKLDGQVQALNQVGVQTDYVIHDLNLIYHNQTPIYNRRGLKWNTKFSLTYFNYLKNLPDYDIYIIRYGLATPSFVKWLKRIKKNNPNTKVIIDMPTYPYREEWTGIKGYVAMMMDQQGIPQLKKYIDLILHSGSEKTIFGIPTYHMTNGITAESFPTREANTSSTLQMIAIGKWQYWHGLDRIVEGCRNYKKPFHLHIVGEGPQSASIKQLIKGYGLQDSITWHSTALGINLDKICNNVHLGIGTLGLHRKGVLADSSLKHREYCARGIPMLISSPDEDFPEGLPFVMYTSKDNVPVDIAQLSSFAMRMNSNEVVAEMRKYAKENLSWTSKMKALIEYI